MLAPQERLWDYEAVEPGQEGHPTVVSLAPEHIAAYALAAQNQDARFEKVGTSPEYGGDDRRITIPRGYSRTAAT
jgi:hypothetical protein